MMSVEKARCFTYPVLPIELRGSTKTEVFAELIESLTENGFVKNSVTALRDVLSRDDLSGTAVFNGVAVPHAKTEAASTLCMALGVSKNDILLTTENTTCNGIGATGENEAGTQNDAYQTHDASGFEAAPTHARIFVLVLWPTMNQQCLDELACLVNTLLDSNRAEKLLQAQTGEEAVACLYGEKTP